MPWKNLECTGDGRDPDQCSILQWHQEIQIQYMRGGGAAPPRDKATSLALCISEQTVAARRLQCHQIPHETTRAAASAWNTATCWCYCRSFIQQFNKNP